MEISAAAVRAVYPRPAPGASEAAARAVSAPGQQAREAVRTAREAGADLPRNAQGVASSAIARGAEPSSVFAALVPPAAEPGASDPADPASDTAPAREGEAAGSIGAGGEEPIEETGRVTEARGREVDAARAEARETAQEEKLADRSADAAAADEAVGVSEANDADTAAEARAEAGDPEALAAREEAERQEQLLADGTARDAGAPGTDDEVRLAAPGEAGNAGQAQAARGAAAGPEAAEGPTFAAPPSPDAPSAADGATGAAALTNAAEAAYAEALAGLRAQARGETADRVV